MKNEVIMVEHLGPNGREMISVEVVDVGIPEDTKPEVAIVEDAEVAPTPKRRRKKKEE